MYAEQIGIDAWSAAQAGFREIQRLGRAAVSAARLAVKVPPEDGPGMRSVCEYHFASLKHSNNTGRFADRDGNGNRSV